MNTFLEQVYKRPDNSYDCHDFIAEDLIQALGMQSERKRAVSFHFYLIFWFVYLCPQGDDQGAVSYVIRCLQGELVFVTQGSSGGGTQSGYLGHYGGPLNGFSGFLIYQFFI